MTKIKHSSHTLAHSVNEKNQWSYCNSNNSSPQNTFKRSRTADTIPDLAAAAGIYMYIYLHVECVAHNLCVQIRRMLIMKDGRKRKRKRKRLHDEKDEWDERIIICADIFKAASLELPPWLAAVNTVFWCIFFGSAWFFPFAAARIRHVVIYTHFYIAQNAEDEISVWQRVANTAASCTDEQNQSESGYIRTTPSRFFMRKFFMGESQNFIDLNKFFRKGHKCLVWVCVADTRFLWRRRKNIVKYWAE